MSNIQLSAASALGVTVLGASATGITGQNIWLIASIAVTVAIGFVAVAMSLVARWYRR